MVFSFFSFLHVPNKPQIKARITKVRLDVQSLDGPGPGNRVVIVCLARSIVEVDPPRRREGSVANLSEGGKREELY